MRIAMPINYGFHASSLDLIVKKLFLELGKLMNKQKSFTISATLLEDANIGDVNQHYDCVSVPNMGGYMFPPTSVLSSRNLFVGLVGIDEVVLGRKVFRTESLWKRSKPIIKKELQKWHNDADKIKHVHVSTESDKEQIIEYLKIPKEKIEIIPLGVDHELYKPPFDKDKIRKKITGKYLLRNKPYFIHISEVNWARKNILRLLESFKKAKSFGIPHNLIIVGKIDSKVVEKAKGMFGVKILGFVDQDDLVNLIQGADALINPSLHEGFGFPLVESMACGVPVITSNVFSPPEVVQEGGLYVDPYNVSDISEKIIEMATNKNLQQDLAMKALKRSEYFSWEVAAKKLLDLFNRCTSTSTKENFDDSYDLAALRTLTTISQIIPGLSQYVMEDLIKFDYSRIINWCFEVGLSNSTFQDYLIPFEKWLEEHSQ